MEKYNLTENDYDIIRKILSMSKAIRFQYNSLMSLEMEDKKSSDEFQNSLQVLNSLITGEKKLYAAIGNDSTRIQALMEYFSTLGNLNNFFEEIKTMIDGEVAELIKRRIIIRLLDIEQKKLHAFGKEIEEEMKELNIMMPKDKTNSYFALANLLELTKVLKQDFLNSLLVLSTEDELVNLKYLVSFLYPIQEDDLTKNNFSDQHNLCWLSQMTADIKGISKETYEEAKENFGYNLILKMLKYLNNKTENNELWNLLLRVALLFCNDDERNMLREQYNITIDLLEKNLIDKNLLLVLSLKG